MSFSLLDEPVLGQLKLDTESGEFTYTPTQEARHAVAKGEPDTDTFTVRITDSLGAIANTQVTVKVSPYNQAPTVTPTATPTISGPITLKPGNCRSRW